MYCLTNASIVFDIFLSLYSTSRIGTLGEPIVGTCVFFLTFAPRAALRLPVLLIASTVICSAFAAINVFSSALRPSGLCAIIALTPADVRYITSPKSVRTTGMPSVVTNEWCHSSPRMVIVISLPSLCFTVTGVCFAGTAIAMLAPSTVNITADSSFFILVSVRCFIYVFIYCNRYKVTTIFSICKKRAGINSTVYHDNIRLSRCLTANLLLDTTQWPLSLPVQGHNAPQSQNRVVPRECRTASCVASRCGICRG